MAKLAKGFIKGPLIQLHNIEVRVGQKTLVTGISLSVENGEVVSIIGPNGAGKTTLIGMICGLVTIKDGTILVNGFDNVKEAWDKAYSIALQHNQTERLMRIESQLSRLGNGAP